MGNTYRHTHTRAHLKQDRCCGSSVVTSPAIPVWSFALALGSRARSSASCMGIREAERPQLKAAKRAGNGNGTASQLCLHSLREAPTRPASERARLSPPQYYGRSFGKPVQVPQWLSEVPCFCLSGDFGRAKAGLTRLKPRQSLPGHRAKTLRSFSRDQTLETRGQLRYTATATFRLKAQLRSQARACLSARAAEKAKQGRLPAFVKNVLGWL